MRIRLNPITRKRLRAFRRMRRAHVSFWVLSGLYGISLLANVLLNDLPLYVRCNGRSYFPVFRYYPESELTGGERQTRPDYKALNRSPLFTERDEHFMVFPLVPFGPNEIISPESIEIPDVVAVRISRQRRIGTLTVDDTGQIARANASAAFFGLENDRDLGGVGMDELIEVPPAIRDAVAGRFANRALPDITSRTTTHDGEELDISLSRYEPRAQPPSTIRLTLREALDRTDEVLTLTVGPGGEIGDAPALWDAMTDAQRATVLERVDARFGAAVQAETLSIEGVEYSFAFDREDVAYPFRPVRGHPLGLDSSGRDVLVQIVYATRISLSFGLLLVISTMTLGILIGAMQGFYGGAIDVIGQRLIEIWSALPFLYIMILLGSVYGQSFGLLLVCYGMFNWIGISYYIRAEFLKLREQPFVEAARVLGLPQRKIIFRHVLPNGLVPVITFFPFSLVGAIGSLAALDYLGFGLPPPTPSWGALLSQGQEFRHAWWLVLFPSVTLFAVILLGVFIGEGVRAAFDPRHDARME